MTRKDYELVARALRRARPPAPPKEGIDHGHASRKQWDHVVKSFSDLFQAEHPTCNFKVAQFQTACGNLFDGV